MRFIRNLLRLFEAPYHDDSPMMVAQMKIPILELRFAVKQLRITAQEVREQHGGW